MDRRACFLSPVVVAVALLGCGDDDTGSTVGTGGGGGATSSVTSGGGGPSSSSSVAGGEAGGSDAGSTSTTGGGGGGGAGGGATASDAPPEVLFDDLSRPEDVAVRAGVVVWAEADGVIGRADRDGQNRSVLTTVTSGSPSGIDLDDTHVYVANYDAGQVLRLPVDGGEPEVVVSGELNPSAVLVHEGWLYWTEFALTGSGGLRRMQLPDGAPETVITSWADRVGGIAVHDGHTYLSSARTGVYRFPLGGTAADAEEVFLHTGSAYVAYLDVIDDEVYWGDGFGSVLGMPVDGASEPVVYAADLTMDRVYGIAVDAENLYFTDKGAGTLTVVGRGWRP